MYAAIEIFGLFLEKKHENIFNLKKSDFIYADDSPVPTRTRWIRLKSWAEDKLLMPILITIIWPAVIYVIISTILESRGSVTTTPQEERRFSVKPEHLLQRYSIEKIEARERVIDPLGAVPNLPFGHLHSVWDAFKTRIEHEDEVWTFRADWNTSLGRLRVYEGYAILRNSEVYEWIVTPSEI